MPNALTNDIISFLNETAGKNYSNKNAKTVQIIKARVKEGYGIDDFKKVVEIKTKQWRGDPINDKYLRPETLFGNKFEGYLNEQIVVQPKQRGLVC